MLLRLFPLIVALGVVSGFLPRQQHRMLAPTQRWQFQPSAMKSNVNSRSASTTHVITALRAMVQDDVDLDKEFEKLCAGKPNVTFMKFLTMSNVQEMINSEVMTMEDASNLWRDIAGDLNSGVDRQLFGQLNKALLSKGKSTPEATDLSGINVFDKSFDPNTVFDKESLAEITDFFIINAGGMDGKLSFTAMMGWDDVKVRLVGIVCQLLMLLLCLPHETKVPTLSLWFLSLSLSFHHPQAMFDEGLMTEEAMKGAWQVASNGANEIDFDSFLRLNVRLDLIMDEMEVIKETLGQTGGKDTQDAEAFYRSEFKEICGSGRLMRLDMLIDWREVRELIDDKVVTEKQISKMFDGMPKEPMGIPANSMGITEDTFVAFNGMLDVLLDAGAGSSGPVRKEAAPSMLVSEPARPMPSVSELKMGSMETKTLTEDEATTGLSEVELEMMEQLDKADNMLNSGSFGDFDRLIGDVNDPRLQALRADRDGAEEVSGQLTDVLKELITLGKQQTRCGLDRPDEETQARIRDLVQAVVEKAPKAASRKIEDLRATLSGGWRLMFTNSEMFDFYNGVTGFANVFPTAKFDSLSVQYSTDGYLSEAQYVEKLTTPLGVIDATVYANWDLLKEMSFMTNENSVVLRNYCTKVRGSRHQWD